MHRFVTLFFLIFIFSGAVMAQRMSDDQVIQYVKEGQKQGKTQTQMTSELVKRGVTREQVERIKSKYEGANASNIDSAQDSAIEEVSRQRNDAPATYDANIHVPVVVDNNVDRTQEIFGHNIFTNRNLTFEPNINIATPSNYKLGPGDEVIIDVWGASETTIRQTISPEGSIQISSIGPVYLNGLTIKDATNYLQREFMKIYAGISGSAPSSQVKLSLGKIRTIQVNIMGEVAVPGTYALSSFSSAEILSAN